MSPAFSDVSAQDTALAAQEAQEWIEVNKFIYYSKEDVAIFKYELISLHCIGFIITGRYREDIQFIFQEITGRWRYSLRVSRLDAYIVSSGARRSFTYILRCIDHCYSTIPGQADDKAVPRQH